LHRAEREYQQNARKYKGLAAFSRSSAIVVAASAFFCCGGETPKQDRVGQIIKGFQRVAVGQPLRQKS